ncbi:serine/threonine-protein kinase [uncultured Paludibaculum sp.]|uniref:serine/threonine-protein kinase n=1 Tax=uncultured Paludibaculum sp. TaxID=1765020 RepID=UPI002AAC487C|nr:serine/threonine-protein kinase [uncultured Paludibaculum sp.]
MTAERWRRVREILHVAMPLAQEQRAQCVEESCAGDGELRADVERMLAAMEAAGDFLEPAVQEPLLRRDSKVGPYVILDDAVRGGMGLVYKAVREDDYRQLVALKMVRPEIETGVLLARFRQERQVLALLNHPNIAHLLDGGTTADGRPYLVMEWVDGTPITEYCTGQHLPLRSRLKLFLIVCQAVAHAHGNLVVHRDLKPSNILITPEGVPKLLDFGIAKLLSVEGDETGWGLTQAGTRALTPDYASPEQVRGDPPSTSSDVYSLGAVLYELLAGAKPHRFTARTAAEMERVVCTEDVVRPSTAAGEPDIPHGNYVETWTTLFSRRWRRTG